MHRLATAPDETPHSSETNTTRTPCSVTSYSASSLMVSHFTPPPGPFFCGTAHQVGLTDAVYIDTRKNNHIYSFHSHAWRTCATHKSNVSLFCCGVNDHDHKLPHSPDAEWTIVCLLCQGIGFQELAACHHHATCAVLPLRHQSFYGCRGCCNAELMEWTNECGLQDTSMGRTV